MTVYVVFFIAFIFLNFNYQDLSPQTRRIFKFLSIFLFILLLGGRKDVGKDYSNYVSYFESIENITYLEPGYDFLNLFVSNLGMDVSVVFLIMALLSSFFIFFSLSNNEGIKTFPTSILIVVFGFIFLSNGVRQGLALSIFFFSYRFVKNRQLFYYLCCILFASLFHYSALLLLPIYYLVNNLFPKWLYISILILSLIAVFSFDGSFLMKLDFVGYINRYDKDTFRAETTLGPGNILVIVFNTLLFFFSLYKNGYKTNYVIFNLFFIYLLLFNLQMSMAILTRLSIYFQWFSFVWVPVIYYYSKNYFNKELTTVVRSLIILYYLIIAINAYLDFDPYQSAWFM